MKCLSLKEPWLQLILDGLKTIETRTWRTRHRGPLLLASSKTIDEVAMLKFIGKGHYVREDPWEPYLGCIRGICSVVSVKRPIGDMVEQLYAMTETEGLWMWRLENVWEFDNPMPIRGMPGVFNIPYFKKPIVEEIRGWALNHGHGYGIIVNSMNPEDIQVTCELTVLPCNR